MATIMLEIPLLLYEATGGGRYKSKIAVSSLSERQKSIEILKSLQYLLVGFEVVSVSPSYNGFP